MTEIQPESPNLNEIDAEFGEFYDAHPELHDLQEVAPKIAATAFETLAEPFFGGDNEPQPDQPPKPPYTMLKQTELPNGASNVDQDDA